MSESSESAGGPGVPSTDGTGPLRGSTVVVAGAASGIGQACALEVAAEGGNLVLADRADLSATRERLVRTRAQVRDVALDVTDEAAWRDLVSTALDRFSRIDALVLAAGMARHVPLLQLSRAEWDEMLAVHLTAAFLALRTVAPVLAEAGGGSVVLLASTVAAGTGPLQQAHYVAAKAGTLGLVRAAARELGPLGIRVNTVSPGFTLTPMNTDLFTSDDVRQRAAAAPLRRVADPVDVARTVTFLLGDGAAMTTGQDLRVDGGSVLS